jgi:hypothetical protein
VKGRTPRESETAQEAGREEHDKRRSQNGIVGWLAKAKGWQQHSAIKSHPTGEEAPTSPIHISSIINWVNPLRPAKGGILTARKGDGAAGRGWRKKRMPSCNGMDRGCVPHAKAG